jgi:AraC-like DNA-binding protein
MTTILSRVLPVERVVAASPAVCAGLFRCEPTHPLFRGGEPCSSFCIVFPREAAWIQHEGGRRFLADASVATLYNQGQIYHRWAVGHRPDRADWLAFPAATVRDVVRTFDPAAADDPERPLRFGWAPVSATIYAAQRRLFDRLKSSSPQDLEDLEEHAVALLHHVVARAYGARTAAPVCARPSRSREAVEHARHLIGRRPEERASLSDLAAAAGLSPFQLCREFRAVTGTTISAYRTDLRVRASLERVIAGEDLTTIALSLGFVSHSHFTHAFRRVLGATPSSIRAAGETQGEDS